MREWLRNIKERLDITSWKAIVHVIAVQLVVQVIWHWISRGFETPLIREIGFLVIFCVALIAVAWYLPKLTPTLSGRSQPKEAKGSSLQKGTEWLEKLAEQDFANLAQRIKVEVRRVNFSGLNDKVPNLELVVSIFNSSVFRAKLLRCDGYIQLSGNKCAPPQLDKLPKLEHGTGSEVKLYQNLNDSTAEWLKEEAEANGLINIVCIMCKLVFQITGNGYDEQVDIVVKDDGLPCIPKGTIVISGGYIATI